ncbi:MFS transporter [[Brevibacterium] frigoritolerans]|uniref:MFS transporter n=1 Tax=Peribacillus frigoritolerans TaxID=450367 RepID=A0A941J366_9BACI|nr:MFS transporter [Peribacillus frigoritolerans]
MVENDLTRLPRNLHNKFRSWFSVAVIFFIALISLLDGVAAPVSAALVPQLVPKVERMKANGFLNVITQTIFVAGWPLGSVLLISTNSSFIIWLTVMLYAVSTIYTGRIKVPEQATDPVAPPNKDSIKSDGLRFVKSQLSVPSFPLIS